MYILGINAFHGDSSACLIKDGVVVCATEEERIRRIKHWAGFPSEAIKFCLNDEGITIDMIDHITISRNPKINLQKKILYIFKNPLSILSSLQRFINSKKVVSIKKELELIFEIPSNKIKSKIHNIEHHRSHIGSSFFASSFKNAAILSIDGFGDFTSTMTALGSENKFKILNEINYPHSLGIFYTTVTQFLGFPNYGDEYKVMGLAPYGNPKYLKELEKIIYITDNGSFKLNKKFFKHFNEGVDMDWDGGNSKIESLFTKEWENLFGRSRNINEEIEKWHIDLACSVQRHTEKIMFHILNDLYEKTKCENLCISGGVAQNSVVNGKILENTPFKNLYVPSAGNDAGTSIGSAMYLHNQILGNNRMPEITTAFFGYKTTHAKIIKLLNSQNIKFLKVTEENLYKIVVDKIISGGVIGWFQGRAEFGPRALGHRSIIVDPRRKDAKDLLNDKIKRRESFRPFAPSILKEHISDYFIQNSHVPFMEKVYEIKENKYDEIPAVTHVDGTGRLQSVDSKVSPKYYNLINEFYKRTGTPILLNTSFNENEPIVNKPEEALDCFLRTEMDMLVMENIIIER
ncbi:MAG: carbamoyltransferase [Flavobacteriales bacterium]|nr:carbamoyltransferase [Flavobacteriales bacterium]MBT5699689.1 carbamoyltransferase [Flavobacteriales bacterium]